MIRIPLTKGAEAIVDDEDAYLLKWKWNAHPDGYAVRMDWDKYGKRVCILMHRVIFGATADKQVDHINHDKADNRRANLRLCSISENHRNTVIRSGGTSRYKGVSWSKTGKKWVAVIKVHMQNRYLGSFSNEIDAARAYDMAAKEASEKFALINGV